MKLTPRSILMLVAAVRAAESDSSSSTLCPDEITFAYDLQFSISLLLLVEKYGLAKVIPKIFQDPAILENIGKIASTLEIDEHDITLRCTELTYRVLDFLVGNSASADVVQAKFTELFEADPVLTSLGEMFNEGNAFTNLINENAHLIMPAKSETSNLFWLYSFVFITGRLVASIGPFWDFEERMTGTLISNYFRLIGKMMFLATTEVDKSEFKRMYDNIGGVPLPIRDVVEELALSSESTEGSFRSLEVLGREIQRILLPGEATN